MPALDAVTGLLRRSDASAMKLAYTGSPDAIASMTVTEDRVTFAFTIVFALLGVGLAIFFSIYIIRDCRRRSQQRAIMQRRRRHLESTAVADGDFARLSSTRVSMDPSQHDRMSQERGLPYGETFGVETEIPVPALDQLPYMERRGRPSALGGLATIVEWSAEMDQSAEQGERYAQADMQTRDAMSEGTVRNGGERAMKENCNQGKRIQVEQVSRPLAPVYGVGDCTDARAESSL